MPLDYMLAVMRDPKADPDRRDAMARAAAPFLHARIAAIEPIGSQPGQLKPLFQFRLNIDPPPGAEPLEDYSDK